MNTAVYLHHQVRVCATTGDDVSFEVKGAAIGFVPIVICGLSTHAVGGTLGV